MREIKFRYWNSVTNKMVLEPEMPYKKGWTIEQLFSDRGWIWQQFTGLLDKHGKEIYEGDVLQGREDTYEVKWDTSMLQYVAYDGGRLALWAFNDPEVIGNIYENPELLQGGDTKREAA